MGHQGGIRLPASWADFQDVMETEFADGLEPSYETIQTAYRSAQSYETAIESFLDDGGDEDQLRQLHDEVTAGVIDAAAALIVHDETDAWFAWYRDNESYYEAAVTVLGTAYCAIVDIAGRWDDRLGEYTPLLQAWQREGGWCTTNSVQPMDRRESARPGRKGYYSGPDADDNYIQAALLRIDDMAEFPDSTWVQHALDQLEDGEVPRHPFPGERRR